MSSTFVSSSSVDAEREDPVDLGVEDLARQPVAGAVQPASAECAMEDLAEVVDDEVGAARAQRLPVAFLVDRDHEFEAAAPSRDDALLVRLEHCRS